MADITTIQVGQTQYNIKDSNAARISHSHSISDVTNLQSTLSVIPKHDTQEGWNALSSFVPNAGQIIIYDIDQNHTVQRIKIGDGNAYLIDLPFVDSQSIITDQDIINWNSAVTTKYQSVNQSVIFNTVGNSSYDQQSSSSSQNYFYEYYIKTIINLNNITLQRTC